MSTTHARPLAPIRVRRGSTPVANPADEAWAEALVRFDDVVSPETGLDADQLACFRHRLLGLLDETIDRVAAINAVRRSRGDGRRDAVDPLLRDRAAAHQSDIEAIGAALAAIDAGVYGTCVGCRQPIGVGTLTDRPWARRCTMCARGAADSVTGPAQPLTEAGR
jgi:RNA polymerase-binding transcription factor DksA